jgi:heme A synthase
MPSGYRKGTLFAHPAIIRSSSSAREKSTMSFVLGVHLFLVYLIWTFGGLGTIWGIVLLVRKRGIDSIMRALLYITAGLGVLQAAMGGILYLSGARPGHPGSLDSNLHFVYGLIVLIGIPVAFVYASNKSARRDMIVYTIAIAAVAAAAVRAFMTGFPM